MPDIQIENQGSIVLLTPTSAAGHDWLHANTEAEGWQWFGSSLAVEPRYVVAIARGAINDGLVVE